MRGREYLPAPAHQEHMQGVRGGGHLPAPAPEEHMQGVRGRKSCLATRASQGKIVWTWTQELLGWTC